MPRHSAYKDHDKLPELNGDTGFVGVNMRLDPRVLPPGYVSEAINCRFNRGVIETRKGMIFPTWANRPSDPGTGGTLFTTVSGVFSVIGGIATNVGTTTAHGYITGQQVQLRSLSNGAFNAIVRVTVIDSTHLQWATTAVDAVYSIDLTFQGVTTPGAGFNWGTIYGVGAFNDLVTLKEYLIVASSNGVYYTTPNNTPYPIALPSGEVIDTTVTFTQAFDRLIMHRGPLRQTLELTSVTSSWTTISQSGDGSGTEPIPNSYRSTFLQNRLFVPFGSDEIAVSDFNDYTRYLPVLQVFRINQGSADSLVTVDPFNDSTIVAFKDHSIYVVSNVYGDLSDARLDELTTKFGCAAAKSVAHVGSDLWFLSELGVMSIRQTELNKLQGVSIPISEPIQPLIDRINWKYAGGSVATYWDNKYYLAVPIDDAEALGENLISTGSYSIGDSGGSYQVTDLVVGATYRWSKGSTDNVFTNGAQTFANSSDFVASSDTATITRTGFFPATISGSLYRVYQGHNNAVLVYDLMNQAWSGYDQSEFVLFSEFIIFHYNHKRRMFFSSPDGYIRMYEEGFEDQLPIPYVDVTVESAPVNGDTISVNGGTAVTASDSITDNSGSSWGIGNGIGGVSLSVAQRNLWIDSLDVPGYSHHYVGFWTAPNTHVFWIPGTDPLYAKGVRFYSTTGLVPQVTVTGAWSLIMENTGRDIVSSFITRQYATKQIDLQDFSWVTMSLETWAPRYSISVVLPGELEEFVQATDRTKARTGWYAPFDRRAFDITNANGDFMDKYRKDYSLLMGLNGTSEEAPEFAVYATADGIRTDLHQSVRETFKVKSKYTGIQVNFSNDRGRFRCIGVLIEGSIEPVSAVTVA